MKERSASNEWKIRSAMKKHRIYHFQAKKFKFEIFPQKFEF